jgi:hypothetical protein
VSRLVIATGTNGGVSSEHFGPRRRKAFSPGSKVEPGLKARTKASLSTSVHWRGVLALAAMALGITSYILLQGQPAVDAGGWTGGCRQNARGAAADACRDRNGPSTVPTRAGVEPDIV